MLRTRERSQAVTTLSLTADEVTKALKGTNSSFNSQEEQSRAASSGRWDQAGDGWGGDEDVGVSPMALVLRSPSPHGHGQTGERAFTGMSIRSEETGHRQCAEASLWAGATGYGDRPGPSAKSQSD